MSGHVPVLLEEAVRLLVEASAPAPRLWLDGTFGRGGHARALLALMAAEDRLVVIDRDPQAIAAAQQLADEDSRVIVLHGEWNDVVESLPADALAGVLLDLGVSSPQLDDAERGFSFAADGPLDMRMNPQAGQSASEWLNQAQEQEISRVIWEYGEERFARRIARSIVESRPLHRTGELRAAVLRALPARDKGKHDATRTFQAVRIHVNNELAVIESVLPKLFARLAPGGRMVVISFHSLEDRLVKRFFRECASPPSVPRSVPVRADSTPAAARLVVRSVTAGAKEVAANPRSRSARLRALERCA